MLGPGAVNNSTGGFVSQGVIVVGVLSSQHKQRVLHFTGLTFFVSVNVCSRGEPKQFEKMIHAPHSPALFPER
jgi:hypothetical protein